MRGSGLQQCHCSCFPLLPPLPTAPTHTTACLLSLAPTPPSWMLPLLLPFLQAYDNAKSIKGKSQAAVLAAIVFLACRHTGNPRTFKEICAVVPQASVKVGG